ETAPAHPAQDDHHSRWQQIRGHRRGDQLPPVPDPDPGLDLAQWAIEDPGRWARWVAPCPIGAEEINQRKAARHRKARMDARTRERLPVLPALARVVGERCKTAAELLEAARQSQPRNAFAAAGQTLTRSLVTRAGPAQIWADDPAAGKRRDLAAEEDRAFWTWAAVEVLRLTGVFSVGPDCDELDVVTVPPGQRLIKIG